MPKIRAIGVPGPANTIIGGVPTVHYLDFGSKGRGEVIRMFCEDAGIAFTDQRWSFEECNGPESAVIAQYNPCRSTPFVEIGTRVLVQTAPILRMWASKLGRYDGTSVDERYFVDVIADIVGDWRTKFVDTLFVLNSRGFNPSGDEHALAHHRSYFLPKYVACLERHLSDSPFSQHGPYVLGSEVTYADFMAWQICHDEGQVGGGGKWMNEMLSESAPRLKRLVEGVAARPNIRAYHASDRYYG